MCVVGLEDIVELFVRHALQALRLLNEGAEHNNKEQVLCVRTSVCSDLEAKPDRSEDA